MTTPRARVAIVGSRDYPNLSKVAEYVAGLPKDTVIVSGGARGVDQAAVREARRLGMTVEEYLPDYTRFPGNVAPLVRNKVIVEKSDRVVAFWDGKSTGTMHTVNLARACGKPSLVVL